MTASTLERNRVMALCKRAGSAAGALVPLAGIGVGVLLWWVITAIPTNADSMMRNFAPAPTLAALRELVVGSSVWTDATSSVWRLAAGLGLAMFAGVLCGAAIGSRSLVERGSRPIVMFLRMVSPLSWAPVAIGLLGVGDRPVIALVASAAVWPILMNTAEGVRRIDPNHLRVARGLGASRMEIIRTIVAPAAQPYVLSGIRQAIGVAWIVLVPAEMLGVTSGLGYAILNAKDQLEYSSITALILIIGLIGYALDAQARWLLQTRRERETERGRGA